MTAAAWDRIATLFDHPGIRGRYGEEVTLGDHMLQAAARAAEAGAGAVLVVAALVHDIGHLTEVGTDPDRRNREHDVVGHRTLAELVPAAVAEPVRLHIMAKRYLVATDASYHERLSPASVHTLGLQGGPLSAAEAARFEADPHHEAALQVRAWDDEAKVTGLTVAGLLHYRPLIEALPPC